MKLASIQVSVKTKLKLDTKEQVRKFKKFMEPYHRQALEAAKEAMQDAIVEKDAYTSGQLFESVTYSLFTRTTDYLEGSVFFDKPGDEYAFFVDQGRKPGGFPPIDKIVDWADNLTGDIDPYAVRFKIAKHGTKGKRFYALGRKMASKAYRDTVKEGLAKYKGKR